MKTYYIYTIAIGFAVSLFSFILTGAWEFLLIGPIITVIAFALRYIVKGSVNRSIREEKQRKMEWNEIFDKQEKRFKKI